MLLKQSTNLLQDFDSQIIFEMAIGLEMDGSFLKQIKID